MGAPCADDLQCASSLCGDIGGARECVECRGTSACPEGRACEAASGRCLPVSFQLRHATTIGGDRRTNAEGRVHVGRVAVVPVTTVVESHR